MHPDVRDRMRQAPEFRGIRSDIPFLIVTIERFAHI
jgi:hypothetical protein